MFKYLIFLTLHYHFNLINSATWDYEEMDSNLWDTAFPEYCNGTKQSPINIKTSNTFACDRKVEWRYPSYSKFELHNNGHTMEMDMYAIGDDDDYLSDNSNCVGKLMIETTNVSICENGKKRITKIHESYCFNSAHFHWGLMSTHGSEHSINGNFYALELHMVHYACKYNNFSSALLAWKNESNPYVLAVVGILFELSAHDNTNLDAILNDQVMSDIIEYDGYRVVDDFKLFDLIPKDKDFYHYKGSLTTPPCTEIVNWYVMKHVSKVSEKQLETLRSLINNENVHTTHNWRNIHNNSNHVYYCQD